MPAAPLCSVLVAAQDCEASIRQTLRSIDAQTYKNVEVIAVDHGSMDHTAGLIAEFCEQKARRQLFLAKRRAWVDVYQQLCDRATGDVLVFVRAGDVLLPNKITQQLATLIGGAHVGAVASHVAYIDARGDVLSGGTPIYNTIADDMVARKLLLGERCIGDSTLMVSRQAMLRVGPLLKDRQYAFMPQFLGRLCVQSRICIVPQVLTHVRYDRSRALGRRSPSYCNDMWQNLGTRAPDLLKRFRHLARDMEGLYEHMALYAQLAHNPSAAEEYWRAKSSAAGLSAEDTLMMVESQIRKLQFNGANDILKQLYTQRERLSPRATAYMYALIGCIQGAANGITDVVDAARGAGAPGGAFTAAGPLPLPQEG